MTQANRCGYGIKVWQDGVKYGMGLRRRDDIGSGNISVPGKNPRSNR